MVLTDFQNTENKNWKYVDVGKKIRDRMQEIILFWMKEGTIIYYKDWEAIEQHFKDAGMIDPPNQFTAPISVIERCMKQVKEEMGNIFDKIENPKDFNIEEQIDSALKRDDGKVLQDMREATAQQE